jgi:hypothetical protein
MLSDGDGNYAATLAGWFLGVRLTMVVELIIVAPNFCWNGMCDMPG